MLSPQVSLGPSTLSPTPIYRLWPVKSHQAPLNSTSSPAPPALSIFYSHSLNPFPRPSYPRPASPSSHNFFPNKSPKTVALKSIKPDTSPGALRALPTLPVVGYIYLPRLSGPFLAHLLSSGRRSSQPPSSIPAPSGRIRGYDVASSLKRGVPATSSLRAPEAPGKRGGTLGGWAQGDALHPG